MDATEHGRLLKTAMARRGMSRDDLASLVEVGVRTVTNWTTGKTMPSDTDRAKLANVFPDYAAAGDPIEVAVMTSEELTEDRKYVLLGTYKRLLREQDEGGQATA